MTETFYDVLGVDPDAATDEIEAAYRQKVKETHPDVSDASDAEERFKRVKRAKEVLTDDDKRARYDEVGHEQYVGYVDGVVDGAQYSTEGTADYESTAAGQSARATGTATGERTAGGTTSDPFGWEETTTSNTGTGHSSGGVDSNATTRDSGTADWQQASGGGESVYATRREYAEQSIDSIRIPLTPESLIQIGTMFLLYPIFLLASVLPLFPTSVNVIVALCTLFVIAYLLSIPEVAIVVFGAWSLLTPALLVSLPGLSVFTLYGTLALVACLFPFGLAVLTQAALRT